MSQLAPDILDLIFAAARRLQLDREALLLGIPSAFTASLKRLPDPASQLLGDIHALNDVDCLSDGSNPLRSWLENARRLSDLRTEQEIFTAALRLLKRPTPTETPSALDRCSRGAHEWQEAPDFAYVDRSHNEIRLSALRGHPVVIHFWAPWCAPSRVQEAQLKKLLNDSRFKNLSIMDINIDDNQETARLYQLASVPVIYIIDEGGLVYKILQGVVRAAQIQEQLLELSE
jgi:thiol-disulfide isomerase/thioredoxin